MGLKDILKRPVINRCRRIYEKRRHACLGTLEEYLEKPGVSPVLEFGELQASCVPEQELLFITAAAGEMVSGAEKIFARFFYEHPGCVVAYCDEVLKNGEKTMFKPDWSPDTFLDHFYFGGLIAVRRSAVPPASLEFFSDKTDFSGKTELLRKLCYDLIDKNGGFNRREVVAHIPMVLFRRESGEPESTEPLLCREERTAFDVSVIIPSKDHPGLLETCVRSLRKTTEGVQLEIVVVDNGSTEENRLRSEALSQELSFRYVYRPMPFHFSKMCNLGAQYAKSERVLFLNDDIECITPGWLTAMCRVAEREHVGAVGCKLLYPDGKRIQHAGVANLPIGPVHKLQFLSDQETYYGGYNRGVRNVLAVTGACMLIRRRLYLDCGGMSEELAVAFNDVELCFRLYERGYYQAVVQDYPLVHHESFSRGDDETTEKWKRLMREREILYRLHPGLEGTDPFYSIHLNRTGLDSRILPAYLEGRQEKEKIPAGKLKMVSPAGAREDGCVLLRVEICRGLQLYGYGVVLGSDNALYEKELLLKSTAESETVYRIPFSGRYRSDLEANMPDQIRVGMSGFWVDLARAGLPAGIYGIGMYAKDLTGHTKLYCFCSRQLEITE